MSESTDSIATHYNLNYDLPIYDPFTHGRYTFYRATDVNNSPMFRPLRLDSKYPRAWEFTKLNAETSFYQVPVCRSQPMCASLLDKM